MNAAAQEHFVSVGDIAFEAKTDDPKFQFCNPDFILQAYEVRPASNEIRKWISLQLIQKYRSKPAWNAVTGFITVRLAVNCLGITDRFRAMSVDTGLHAAVFPEELTTHLILLVKEVRWPIESYRDMKVDYYQDVTFKIVRGELKEVML